MVLRGLGAREPLQARGLDLLASAPGAAVPEPTLYVALYDSSSAQWSPAAGTDVALTVLSTFSSEALAVAASVSVAAAAAAAGAAAAPFSLAFRVPPWCVLAGATATVDGAAVPVTAPWTVISRAFQPGAPVAIELSFPFVPLLEALDDDRPEFSDMYAVTVRWRGRARLRAEDPNSPLSFPLLF